MSGSEPAEGGGEEWPCLCSSGSECVIYPRCKSGVLLRVKS